MFFLEAEKKMKLTGNQIKYLIAIKKISDNKHVVRSVDVARDLHYSRASVHKMLESLKDLKLITQEYYGSLKLTSSGSKMARECLEKYAMLEEALKPVLEIPEDYNIGICNLIELM